jgi:hypothetical protein
MMQTKGQFRETMWFKLGEQAAPPPDDGDAPSAVERPVEDRYLDDGTVTREDSAVFGIHTGYTQCLRPICDTHSSGALDEPELAVLVHEMKRKPGSVVAAIGLSCVGLATLLLLQLV